jgi:predicted Zn-dependent protease
MCEHHNDGTKFGSFGLKAMHRRDLVRGLWAGTIVLGVAAASGCETVSEFLAPTDDQLLAASAQAWAQTKAETPISNDRNANRRLQAVGPKIATASGMTNVNWEFVVFDSQEKNAWVLPGGKVGFYKGLMDFCDNDDQVAAVLGHEVGHVVKRHAALRAGEQSAEAIAAGFAGQYISGTPLSGDQQAFIMQIYGAGSTVLGALPFSRAHESEADRVGVDYMKTAGFDVNQSVRLWEKMAANSGSRPLEMLSTHPDPSRRANELKEYIRSMGY